MLSRSETVSGRGDLPTGLLQRLTAAQARSGEDISQGSFTLCLAALLGLAAALQTGLLLAGLYSLSADESARALLAHRLSFANAFDPFIWPPLGTIINSLALGLHDDLFLTPRLLVSATGLLAILSVAFVAYAVFGNRLIALVAAGLSILVPQRLLVSVAPLSDIFGTTLLLFAMGFVFQWLRGARMKDLTAACVLLLFAAMTRYEFWFFNAVFGLYLAYRTLIRRDLGFGALVLNGALLSCFPIFWVLRTYFQDGNLDLFSMTSRQFIDKNGRNYLEAIQGNVAVDLLRDLLLNPVLLLGGAVLVFLSCHQKTLREWAILILVPFVILATQMAVSLGVPMAAQFRIDGVWVLMLLPFAAFALVFAAEKLTVDRPHAYAALALAAYIAVVPFGLRAHTLASTHQDVNVMSRDDLALGRYLQALVKAEDRNILLDSMSSLGYLNVPVAANMPERFTLDVDAELVSAALYVDARQSYIAQNRQDIVERYLTDKFALAGKIDRDKLKARNIGFLVIQTPALVKALDENPDVTPLRSFGSWVVYRLKG